MTQPSRRGVDGAEHQQDSGSSARFRREANDDIPAFTRECHFGSYSSYCVGGEGSGHHLRVVNNNIGADIENLLGRRIPDPSRSGRITER